MPRPKSPHPKVKVHFALPQETVALLRITFASENYATGVVHGAMSAFVNEAILEKLELLRKGSRDGAGSEVHTV